MAINSRNALAVTGATITGAALAVLPSHAATGADAELIRLGKQLDEEMELERRLATEFLAEPRSNEDSRSRAYDAWVDCLDRVDALVKCVDPLEPVTMAGAAVKAQALLFELFLWEVNPDEEADRFGVKAMRKFVGELRKAAGVS
jgi:hypothetical protein